MKLTVDQAIEVMEGRSNGALMIGTSYMDRDPMKAARRFAASAEFKATVQALGPALRGARCLDLGCGNGMASWALVKAGAASVLAVEPDSSARVGAEAARRVARGLPVKVVSARGEALPARDASLDIVYTRQVLHHIVALPDALREVARVLKPGGLFLACREHVVDNAWQKRAFLARHPMHQLAENENAHSLPQYLAAITAAGLELRAQWGPWDSLINAFPAVETDEDMRRFAWIMVERKLGAIGRAVLALPGVEALAWAYLKRPIPGRLYSFLAVKPGAPAVHGAARCRP